MVIGGFDPFSLLDYPDKVAAIIFTQGCNFRCRYCYNPSLIDVSTKEGDELSRLWSFLAERQGLVEAVVITGGEPTLQKDLVEVIQEIKRQGFLTKLDTNGTNPAIVKDLIAQGLVDYLAVDVKAPWSKYGQIMAMPEAALTILVAKVKELVTWLIDKAPINYEFRTTLVPGLLGLQDLSLIHISEPTRLLSISYAVFCLKKKKKNIQQHIEHCAKTHDMINQYDRTTTSMYV